MIRFVLTVLLTVAVFMFTLENFHAVPVRFFVANPIQVRLIFIIFSSMGLGVLITVFYSMAKKLKRTSASQKADAVLEDDIFDEE